MELVYLWVDEYKNIRNQGFNFSPKFECEFKAKYNEDGKLEDNCELNIKHKKYIENFFNENINITAIVGENGTGKSNLLELINNIAYEENPHKEKSYPIFFYELIKIAVYYDKLKKKLFVYKENLNSKIKNESSIINEEITNESVQKIFIKPIPTHNQQEYLLLLDFLINNNMDFPFDIPKIINFHIHDDYYDLLKLIENENFNVYDYYSSFEEDSNKKLKISHILLLLAYLKNYEINFKIQVSQNYDNTISDLEEYIDESIKLKIRSFIKILSEDFSLISNNYVNKKNISNDFFKIYIEIIKRKNKNELLDFKGKNIFYFNLYPKMSDGQYQLTYIFNTIYSQMNQDTIILSIDEGENSLHPNWQKKYINYLYTFLKDNFPSKEIHIIVSSHSPFLLSDLPKENIIFLDKFDDNSKEKYPSLDIKNLENGNCINVSKDIELKTFGANIHTLLSDGFFMSDGLMGEFAKSKINEIKEFYDANKNLKKEDSTFKSKKDEFEKNKKYFENIQKIIGEPFLQIIIKNYLDELEILFNGKKEFLNNEIKRLQDLQKSLND